MEDARLQHRDILSRKTKEANVGVLPPLATKDGRLDLNWALPGETRDQGCREG